MSAIKQDGPYDSRTLTKVFFGSSIALAATVVWMVGDDWSHQWRPYQREFRDIQRKKGLSDVEEAKRAAKPAELAAIAAVDSAKAMVEAHESQLSEAKKELDKAQARKEAADIEFAVAKSKVDSYTFYFEHSGAAGQVAEHNEYSTKLAEALDEQERRGHEKEQANQGVTDATARIEALEKPLLDAKKALEDATAAIGKSQRAYDKIAYSFRNDWLRNEPGVDFLDPTEKPEKQVIPGITWDYYFAQVRTVDFCQSCHKGIDARGFEGSIISVPGASNVPVAKVETAKDGGYDVTLPQGHVDHIKAADLLENVEVKKVFQSHPNLDLYLTAASPHPVERFGCTPCHLGEGNSITFTTATHAPNSESQREEWGEKYKWQEREHWNWPQFPTRYVQASCLLCHPNNRPVPGADKLNFGRETWERLSCVGCHKMKGYEDEAKRGPDLRKMTKKLDKDWVAYWIENPQRFRPKTNMPRFFNGPECALTAPTTEEKEVAKKPDENKSKRLYDYDAREQVEIKAIVRFLYNRSETYLQDEAGRGIPFNVPTGEVKQGNAARGKVLFTARGCVGCHRIESTSSEDTALRTYAPDEFGPNLFNLAHKLNKETAKGWIYTWISNPKHYWSETRMPNLRIDENDVWDLVSYLYEGEGVKDAELKDVKPKGWVDAPLDPAKGESVQLEYALRDYLDKDFTADEVDQILKGQKVRQQDGLTDESSRLMYLGEQTISRLGCFGCHYIKGMESRPGIGRELSDIGDKNLTQVDWGFESVSRFMDVKEKAEKAPGKIRENRHEWLTRKVEMPRCFDRGKYKDPLDRSRMPQFKTTPFEREALVTYLLGHTANRRVPDEYKYKPSLRKANVVEGEYAILRNNCKACHLFGVDKVVLDTKDGPGRVPAHDPRTGVHLKSPLTGAPITQKVWVDGHLMLDNMKAYGTDNGGAILQVYADTPSLGKDDQGQDITKGVGELVSICADATIKTVDEVRSPVTGADADLLKVVELTPPEVWGQDEKSREEAKSKQLAAIKKSLAWRNRGGTSLEKIIEARVTEKVGMDPWLTTPSDADKKNFDLDKVRGPAEDAKTFGAPHLIREGRKVQPLWLQSFLKEPTEIRPNLRPMPDWDKDRSLVSYEKAGGTHMPTYGFSDAGTQVFSRYFAALDENERIAFAQKTCEEIQAKVKAKTKGYQTRLEIQNVVYPMLDTFKAREYFNVVIVDGVFNFAARGDVALSRALDQKTDPYMEERETKDPGWYSAGYRFFQHKDINCQNCHMIKGRTPTGSPEAWAPDLGRVRERLQPDYLVFWINNPKSIIPGTKMTKVFMEGNLQDIMPGDPIKQIDTVVDWLMAGAPAVLDAYPATVTAGSDVRLTSELLALDNAAVEQLKDGSWVALKDGEFTREKSQARVSAISVKTSSPGTYKLRVKDGRFTAYADVTVQ
jgi:mono/diheme cytochrome c family protein